jgi:hypothetical protein
MADGDGAQVPPAPERNVGPLRFIVAGEAQRALSDAQIEADPARVAAGWERRFIASGARAEEMKRLYEALGFEVAADPVRPDQIRGDCEDCRVLIQLQFEMIYTRRKDAAST